MKVNEFIDGAMAKNITRQMLKLPPDDLKYLYKNRMLYKFRKQVLPVFYRNYKIEYIEKYAALCNCSVRKLLFGTEVPPKTYYTMFGDELINAINQMPPLVLEITKAYIMETYKNSLMDIEGTPYQKINALLAKIRRPASQEAISSEVSDCFYTDDPWTEIVRFRDYNNSETFHMIPDYMPDVANIMGVSFAWILNLKENPLICDTVLGDEVLSLITLQVPKVQASIVAFLLEAQRSCGGEYYLPLKKKYETYIRGYADAI